MLPGVRWPVLLLLGAAAAAVALVVTGALPVALTRLLADLTGLWGAAAATTAFATTAYRQACSARWLMALGLAGWCAGQAVWTWHRSVDGRTTTFPDVENALYLVLPCCVGAALILAARRHSGDQRQEAPTRVLVLDALLLCLGVVGLTWETTIGAATRSTQTIGDLALASSYMISDLGLIMLALVLALGLRRMWRRSLLWLIAGLLCISFSDAVYAYMLSTNQIAPSWADAGYMSGPWLLAVGAWVPDRPFRRREATSLVVLPYIPVAAALGLTLLHTITAPHRPSMIETYVLIALLCLVIVRQLISQQRLAAAHRALGQRARTDSLTSAANRDGLYTAYARIREHDHRETNLGIVLCDLDQFKPINDSYGHTIGDTLLKVIAARLHGCVRHSDLVVRLGGDEFVLLLDPAPTDPSALTTRLADDIAAPITIDGHDHHVTASLGYSTLQPGDTLTDALTAADQHMYHAKTRRH